MNGSLGLRCGRAPLGRRAAQHNCAPTRLQHRRPGHPCAAGTPEEHPTARRNGPFTSWQHTTDALDHVHQHLAEDTAGGTGGEDGGALAQAQITALGDIINATAQTAPQELRAELRAATRAFARAQRSQIRADHQVPPTCAGQPATSSTPATGRTATPSPS